MDNDNTTIINSTTHQDEDPSDPSKNDLRLYHFIINVYIDGFLCLLGLLGNIMILVVIRKEKSKTSNSVLLQGLAVFDLCFLMYVILYVVLRSVNAYTGNMAWLVTANPYIVAFVLPFGWTSQTGTIWMVMAIAIDRYLVVSQPLRSVQWCTVKNARRAVVAVAAAAVLFNAPRWPRYYFVAFAAESSSNSTFVSHQEASISGWDENLYRIIYHIVLTLFFLFLIPLTTIILLNARLIYHVKAAAKKRLSMAGNQSNTSNQSLNITKIMVIMITIFVICELPDFVASIIGAGKFKVHPTFYEYYAGVKEALLVFNSAVNFYLYCAFYTKFRDTLLGILGRGNAPGLDRAKTVSAGSLATVSSAMTNSTQSLPADSGGKSVDGLGEGNKI